VTLSRQLEQRHGKNFEERNLRRIIQFAEIFDDYNIVATLSPQLSWSHLIVLLTVKKKEALVFYAQKAASKIWSVRDSKKNKVRNILQELRREGKIISKMYGYWESV
jgi:hypothetical protein